MAKYWIIWNLTENSMAAVDSVLTEFDGGKIADICRCIKLMRKTCEVVFSESYGMTF